MGARSVSARKENQMREIFFFGHCGNAIAENGRKKKIVVAKITCEELKKKVLRLQYFYNIFTTNHRSLVIINLNLNLTLILLF